MSREMLSKCEDLSLIDTNFTLIREHYTRLIESSFIYLINLNLRGFFMLHKIQNTALKKKINRQIKKEKKERRKTKMDKDD